jgi:nitrite reductase (NO-forming)
VTEKKITRREALKRIGGVTLFGAGVAGGALGGQVFGAAPASAGEPGHDHSDGYGAADPSERRLSGDLPAGSEINPYGGDYSPPDWMDGSELDGVTTPPPPSRQAVREIEIAVVEKQIQVSRAYTVDAWTYNGTAPGPTLRATEGELLRIRFRNLTGHDHNLHFHGRHSPLHDGWEPVPPGGEAVYEIEAGPAGVHPYHCHTMPIDEHIARGLYGMFIVDPPGGRPPAHEVVLILSGWDPDRRRHNELYSWNGIAGFYDKFPIKIPAGEPVRAYVLNATEYDPVTSFHLHAQTFEVYPAGIGDEPAYETDIVTFGQMDRAILEFTLPERGRYMFHPHQHSIAMRGAMGWFSAI